MDLELREKVCVVTGASSGIGLETARRLAAEGAQVLMVARDAERLEAAASEIGADYVAADVTDAEADERIVATCAEQMGGIDVLINNAGTSFAKSLDDLTDDDWNGQWELHVLAPMRLMRAAAPRMAERGGGRIVNVCSSAGKRPSLTNAAYSVTKAAQLSLSRVFADSFAAGGVLVNAVTPGPVASPLWLDEGGLADQTGGVLVNAVTPGPVASPLWLDEGGLADQTGGAKGLSRDEALDAQADKVPLGRFAEPGEIADVIAFLSSARASTVTGAAWSVDGGAVAIIV